MNSCLELKGVTKRFSGLTAVNGLDLTIEEKTIHALIGPNGSGKTTTLNMISGALPVTSGSIFFYGKDITTMAEYERARVGIRRTFQNLKLFASLTVLENVMLGTQGQDTSIVDFIIRPGKAATKEKEMRERAMHALDYVGVGQLADRLVNDIPYGQQKLIEIARALVGEPKTVMLDEPATGLNPTERRGLVDLLQRLKMDGKNVLIIEHNMDVIMTVSDIITVINFGKKICEGTPDVVKNDPEVIKAYLGAQYKKEKEAEK